METPVKSRKRKVEELESPAPLLIEETKSPLPGRRRKKHRIDISDPPIGPYEQIVHKWGQNYKKELTSEGAPCLDLSNFALGDGGNIQRQLVFQSDCDCWVGNPPSGRGPSYVPGHLGLVLFDPRTGIRYLFNANDSSHVRIDGKLYKREGMPEDCFKLCVGPKFVRPLMEVCEEPLNRAHSHGQKAWCATAARCAFAICKYLKLKNPDMDIGAIANEVATRMAAEKRDILRLVENLNDNKIIKL